MFFFVKNENYEGMVSSIKTGDVLVFCTFKSWVANRQK